MASISPSRRVRVTPFTQGVEAAGVRAYTVYNHMLLPTMFESVEADYHHLKNNVQVWDVACERQIAVQGPDARKLVQMMTPRDVTKQTSARCFYVPMTDHNGGMVNDPILLQPAADTYWLSIADSDVALWASAIGACNGLDVKVWEPDVSPLAVQGPKAEELISRVFGPEVCALSFFGCGRFAFEGKDFLIARSGWSKQGGFEIYVEGTEYGMPLWDALFAAGEDLNVRAGCPNLIERIEGGLLSLGNDMDITNTPLECGLGKYVSDNQLDTCFGGHVLREERANGSRQMIRPIEIEGELTRCIEAWPVFADGKQVGQVTSAARSPDFGTNVAIGMVANTHWLEGTKIEVESPEGMHNAVVREKFWI
jgi:dimethylsulfoniopropionate demethylase